MFHALFLGLQNTPLGYIIMYEADGMEKGIDGQTVSQEYKEDLRYGKGTGMLL